MILRCQFERTDVAHSSHMLTGTKDSMIFGQHWCLQHMTSNRILPVKLFDIKGETEHHNSTRARNITFAFNSGNMT
jgi:hypothetical protein